MVYPHTVREPLADQDETIYQNPELAMNNHRIIVGLLNTIPTIKPAMNAQSRRMIVTSILIAISFSYWTLALLHF
jgi:hypothetical protein